MDRRKFLVGMGSLAAGSAAALGTGAFTSVTAERTVEVNVAGDASAYLGLEPVSSSPNSDFVEVNGDEVSFDFTSSNSNVNGNGFNPDATTRINDLLHVTNQGTQDVNFWVNIENLGAGSGFVTIEASNRATFESNFRGSTTGLSSQLAYDGGNAGSVSPVTITTGGDLYLHLIADAVGESPNSFSGSVTFVAEDGGTPGN
jgi:hypothetical protein